MNLIQAVNKANQLKQELQGMQDWLNDINRSEKGYKKPVSDATWNKVEKAIKKVMIEMNQDMCTLNNAINEKCKDFKM